MLLSLSIFTMSSESELSKSWSPLSDSSVSSTHTILSRSRVSPSRRLTRSLAKTAGTLSTPNQLNRLLTLTNAQRTQTSYTTDRRLSQSLMANSSFSASLNPSTLSATMLAMPLDSSSLSTTSTMPLRTQTIFATPSVFSISSVHSPNILSSDVISSTPSSFSPLPFEFTSGTTPFSTFSLPTFNSVSLSVSSLQPLSNILATSSQPSTFFTDTSSQTVRRYRSRIRISQLPLARRHLVSQQSYRHSLELCNIVCSACNSMHWIQERSSKSSKSNLMFIMCCGNGHISLPPLNDAPIAIHELLTNQTSNHTFCTFLYLICSCH